MICKKEANPIRKNAVKQFVQQHSFYVGVSGLEPEKAGPESAVLPLHHTPNLGCIKENPSSIRVQNYCFLWNTPNFSTLF